MPIILVKGVMVKKLHGTKDDGERGIWRKAEWCVPYVVWKQSSPGLCAASWKWVGYNSVAKKQENITVRNFRGVGHALFQINFSVVVSWPACLLVEAHPWSSWSGSVPTQRKWLRGRLLPNPLFDFCVVKTKAAPSFKNPFCFVSALAVQCVRFQRVEKRGNGTSNTQGLFQQRVETQLSQIRWSLPVTQSRRISKSVLSAAIPQ